MLAAEQVDRAAGEIDADRCADPAREGLVGLHGDVSRADAAGDERMVAHEFGRVDLARDLAVVGRRDPAVLRSDAGRRRPVASAGQVPKVPPGLEKRPSANSPSRKFIGGEPMKPATNRLAGAL